MYILFNLCHKYDIKPNLVNTKFDRASWWVNEDKRFLFWSTNTSNFYKKMLLASPDAVARFVLEVEVRDIVARNRNSPSLPHTRCYAHPKLIEISFTFLFGLALTIRVPMYVRCPQRILVVETTSRQMPVLLKVLKWSTWSTNRWCSMKRRNCNGRCFHSFQQLLMQMVCWLHLEMVRRYVRDKWWRWGDL